MHCITLAKEEKKEKGNPRVMFLHFNKLMSRV